MLLLLLLLTLLSSATATATTTATATATSLPYLNVDGFSWAENLCFDGNGNLFVSDWRRCNY